jgi:heme A synthase
VLLFAAIAVVDYAQRIGPISPGSRVTAYLAGALILYALVLAASVIAFRTRIEEVRRPVYETPFARLALAIVPLVFLALVSGSYLTASDAAGACPGWPLCGPGILPQSGVAWVAMLHRLAVAAAGLVAKG